MKIDSYSGLWISTSRLLERLLSSEPFAGTSSLKHHTRGKFSCNVITTLHICGVFLHFTSMRTLTITIVVDVRRRVMYVREDISHFFLFGFGFVL